MQGYGNNEYQNGNMLPSLINDKRSSKWSNSNDTKTQNMEVRMAICLMDDDD